MLQRTAPEHRPCKVCTRPFLRLNSMQTICGRHGCSVKLGGVLRKEERKATKARLADMKPLSHWFGLTQVAFNAYIRARDAHESCISCGRMHAGAHDAGHYLTTGARPELRFDEDNTNKQCVPCNQHLHGNTTMYRIGLIEKRGLQVVERLEGHHPPAKWTRDDLEAMRATYRAKAKELSLAATA